MTFKPAVFTFLIIATAFGQQPRTPERLVQYPVRGTRGAVAGGSNYATDAGMRMFYLGGNAVDAGVATIFSAATTEYERVGWGGEAPILIRTKDGKVHSIAGVGTMPKLATADLFRNRPLQLGEILEPPEKNGVQVAAFRKASYRWPASCARWCPACPTPRSWHCAITAPSPSTM